MEHESEYERQLVPLAAAARDLLLRLETALKAGPPGPEAVYIAAMLHEMRGPMAAVELNGETIASARHEGADGQWGRGFASGFEHGLRAAGVGVPGGNVIPLDSRRAITA